VTGMTENNGDTLSHVALNWESLAKSDPLWAILSVPNKKGNKWDINDFLATGKQEIDGLINYMKNAYRFQNWHRALDFGCGIGRLTLPLAQYFDHVVGIDISDTMISMAQDLLNKSDSTIREKIEYVLNKSNTLPFEDSTFDLVYSKIVLQHLHKNDALLYISEFVRILKKDGLAIFQAPSRCFTTLGERFKSHIDTQEGTAIIEMNLIPIIPVIDTIYKAGGKIMEIKKDYSATEAFESFKYYVSK
jgi:ubiquinone/menaquinone biosynthesis C-methylase UbiE